MNTAKRIYEADEDGVVHVLVPTGKPRTLVEVLVVWEDAQDPCDETENVSDLVGLLTGMPIERWPQGSFEKRDELK